MGEAEELEKAWLVRRDGLGVSMDMGTLANHTHCLPSRLVNMSP